MLELISGDHDAYGRLNQLVAEGRLRIACAHEEGFSEDTADIAAVSFPGDISGTGVMLLVKVAERGKFTRAEDITLNGLHGFIGPAPNERLGVVDVLVTGGMVSDRDPSYTGISLLTDLLDDKEIELDCLSLEHTRHTAMTRLSIMEYARATVYDMPLDPVVAELAQDDLFAGATVFLNGGRGVILGSGAYGTATQPSLSCACDCFVMDRKLLLPPAEALPARHTATFLLPLWNSEQSRQLAQRIADLALEHTEEESLILRECERTMAKALGTEMLFPDPGPRPYRTIVSRA